MKSYKWYVPVYLIIMIIFQPFLSQWFEVGGISINFVLYFTMLFAFTKKPAHSITVAAVVGLTYDMIYSNWLGKMIILLVVGTIFVMIVDKRIYRENIPGLILFFFAAIFLLENINTIMETGFGEYFGSILFIQTRILWMSLYAAALSIIAGIAYFLTSLRGDRKIRMKGA